METPIKAIFGDNFSAANADISLWNLVSLLNVLTRITFMWRDFDFGTYLNGRPSKHFSSCLTYWIALQSQALQLGPPIQVQLMRVQHVTYVIYCYFEATAYRPRTG
jgi:hypothetical protein